jgi:hypothetical protein
LIRIISYNKRNIGFIQISCISGVKDIDTIRNSHIQRVFKPIYDEQLIIQLSDVTPPDTHQPIHRNGNELDLNRILVHD